MRVVAEQLRVYSEDRPPPEGASVALTVVKGRWRAQLKAGTSAIDQSRDFDTRDAAEEWAKGAVGRANHALDVLAAAQQRVAAVMDPLRHSIQTNGQ